MIHTATIKIKVVLGEPSPPPPPPPPPFVGTKIKIAVSADELGFGINHIEKSDEVTEFSVDWGDGITEEGRSITNLTHFYSTPGSYEIRISDGINNLTLAAYQGETKFVTTYPLAVREVQINATRLTSVGTGCFYNCKNLTKVGFTAPNVATMPSRCFQGCASLSGRLDFPAIASLGRILPFAECTGGITEIHFPAASEVAITSSSIYKADPTLGSGNAVCVFDL